jgi:hypothetical protein
MTTDKKKLRELAVLYQSAGRDFTLHPNVFIAILDELEAKTEALECAEYALTHPESNQAFAIDACHSALSQSTSEVGK